MIANYHTHTPFCRHAKGEEREYVENAIRAGFKILGFSDHVPQIFSDGLRMPLHESRNYMHTIRTLAEEYKKDITIYCGFEVEYYPLFFPMMHEFGKALHVDYYLLGQHFLFDKAGSHRMATATSEEQRLTSYVDQVLEGLATGVFTYLAHPDIIHFTGDEKHYDTEMTRLCQGAKAMDIPLEINMLGLIEHRHYPCGRFYRIAAAVGNDVIVGCDAHHPSHLLKTEALSRARALAEDLGCKIVETVRLRPL